MTDASQGAVRIGADVGGTFTDVILIDAAGKVWTHKLPSTPPNFEQAVLSAIESLLHRAGAVGGAVNEVAHGTTVATNAVLERRGARTALLTTRGFRDVLELRRIRAPQLYDLFFEKPLPLVERHLRFEVGERVSAAGEVLAPLQEAELAQLAERLKAAQVESAAVCFLHSYAFPQHEQRAGDFLRQHLPQLQVSLSCEVLPERREYERTATTVVNAYVRPVVQGYLRDMRSGLRDLGIEAPLLIMQSAGGLTPQEDAARRPVFALESGPAAGVLAAAAAARRAGLANLISLDMGGTTAKASLIEGGQIAHSPEYEVGASLSAGSRLMGGSGELIRAPSIDIAEVGAGGGSIAYLDRAGGLRVGPRSAGSVPGPACYGRGGTQPTVTDADAVLGYIRPGALADGQVSIDLEAARRAVYDSIAVPLGMGLLEAAEGIHRIANARTMRALRQVSTERGRDPRDFALMAFGGAGPLHAAGLACELAIGRILVPPLPGLFSAVGLLCAGIEHHSVRSCLLWGGALTPEALERLGAELREEMLARFAAEGYPVDQVELRYSADMRFRGQTSEIRMPLILIEKGRLTREGIAALGAAFAAAHEQLYGHRSDPDNPIEVVAVRLIGRAELGKSSSSGLATADIADTAQRFGLGRARTHDLEGALAPAEPAAVLAHSRPACFGAALIDTPVLARGALLGRMAEGPLLIDEYDSTIVVPPGLRAFVDEQGNVVMEPRDA